LKLQPTYYIFYYSPFSNYTKYKISTWNYKNPESKNILIKINEFFIENNDVKLYIYCENIINDNSIQYYKYVNILSINELKNDLNTYININDLIKIIDCEINWNIDWTYNDNNILKKYISNFIFLDNNKINTFKIYNSLFRKNNTKYVENIENVKTIETEIIENNNNTDLNDYENLYLINNVIYTKEKLFLKYPIKNINNYICFKIDKKVIILI
jgi:hypothetical protein